jgi:hypothetical protein
MNSNRSSPASPLLDKISLFLKENSLLRIWKFPVPLRREFRCKLLNPRIEQTQKWRDFDSQKDLVQRFGAQKQSTLIAFKGDKEQGRSVGDSKRDSIAALLNKVL